jgi:NAD(P)-dependent dehydrogenase (short-subunit alcohol dehydrogenase family)
MNAMATFEDLEGNIAIVTGAAQGIGRGIAQELARQKCLVAVADLNLDGARETVASIQSAGSEAFALACDVSQRSDVEGLVTETLRRWSRIDILVNNAGTYPRKAFLELDDQTWSRVIQTNLYGTFICSQIVANEMVARNTRGRIVNLGSTRSVLPAELGGHYGASKAGIMSITRTMALELARHGIRVNAIAPGVSDTAQPREVMTDEDLAAAGQANPLGRIGQPEDSARVVAFLVSDYAAYVTGQTIFINGGGLMH